MNPIVEAIETTNAFEPEILAYEAADRAAMPPVGEILFVGSSTFTFWVKPSRDFPGFHIINRGFGGSELSDSIYFARRIVLPYVPRQVVLYAGENDIGNGKPPELVARDFRRFVELVHSSLPQTVVTFLSIKPSIGRWALDEEIRDANERVEQFTCGTPNTSFIDTYHPTLTPSSELQPHLYIEDGVHLNRDGYRLWSSVMASHLIPAAPTP